MSSTRFSSAVFVCLAAAHLGCGGGAGPVEPTRAPAAPAKQDGGTASGAAATSSAVPPHLQQAFDRLPSAWQKRFLSLKPEAQQRIALLPEHVIEGWVQAAERFAQHEQVALNDPPDAIFKTRPPARGDEIRGRAPLEVIFNMCVSTDPDEGDQLKHLYDFEGDGDFVRGPCRMSHVYEEGTFEATVCVDDRQPFDGHRVCRTYTVEARGRARCETITSGSGTVPPSSQVSFFTGFFDVTAGSGLIQEIGTSTPALYGPNAGFGAINSAYCGAGGPFYAVQSYYRIGYSPVYYSYPTATNVMPADYSGCYNQVGASGYYAGSFQVSWKTEVCDPGSF